MPCVNLDPIAVFDSSIPRDLQQMWFETLQKLYRSSVDAIETLVKTPHDKDIHAPLRRAFIEEKLERSVIGHRDIQSRIETNRSGNSHVVIDAPNFKVTEAYVKSPNKIVRWASYRDSDSLVNYPLFATIEQKEELSAAMRFNAILLHGSSRRSKRELGFAVIRFPQPGFKSYLPDCINLLDRFSAASHVSEPGATENIPDSIDPKIITDRPVRKDS